MTQVADRIWVLGGGGINFYAVEEGGRLTLVDTGLRGSWGRLVRGLEAIGHTPGDIEAVLLTHAHRDHTGSAERVRREASAQVRIHEDDEPFVRRRGLLFAPGVPVEGGVAFGRGMFSLLAAGISHVVAARSLLSEPIKEVTMVRDGETLDVPGRPRAHYVPGHTPGSCAFLLSSRGALFTGDALVTHDLVSGGRGPRVARRMVNNDHAQAVDSLATLASLEADVLLPGHGNPWRGPVADAVAVARDREGWR